MYLTLTAHCWMQRRGEVAAEPGMEALKDHWLSITKAWRERQLRYSWLCSMMGRYDDFWEPTSRALDTTLEEHGLASEEKVRDRLLSLYGELSAHEEVPGLLADLKAAGHKLAVLSNASPNMLETATQAAGIYQYFDALLSVDILKCYKPTPVVYGLVTEHFGCNPGDVTFLLTTGTFPVREHLALKPYGLIATVQHGINFQVFLIA